MYPICYRQVSGRYFQPEPAMYSRCFCWFPGPLAPSVYQAAKGPGMTERSLDSLSLDDFILAGSISARRRLKRLSLAPYYAAQMKRCTQKWDRRDDQGASLEAINVSRQLIGMVGTGLYHSMAEVQATVGRTVDPV